MADGETFRALGFKIVLLYKTLFDIQTCRLTNHWQYNEYKGFVRDGTCAHEHILPAVHFNTSKSTVLKSMFLNQNYGQRIF
eukprot:jgi/Botrbrau1/3218/Bobra.37_2s0047.1